MKYIISFILFFSLLYIPIPMIAHLAGQPPFFKINDIYSNLYPVPSTSLDTFMLPQDIGAENYLINENLTFVVDVNALSSIVPYDVIKKATFLWDYGDGEKSEGLTNTHAYTKIGSYLLTIHVDTSAVDNNPKPQLIQSVLINILPSPEYKLPKAVLFTNGNTSNDPLVDTLTFHFGDMVQFDGSKSDGGASTITNYFWDFGDGESSTQKSPKHMYKNALRIVFPFVRVQTADGFVASTFLQINNDTFERNLFNNAPSITITPTKKILSFPNIVFISIGIILLILFGLSRKRK